MDALTAIFTRRSVRNFTDEPVSEEHIQTVLKAAMLAPSAGNQRPWEFIIIKERTTLDQIPTLHPHAKMMTRAQLAILVCGVPNREKYKNYFVQDCAAATQNILLAARAIGLGAVWLGVHPNPEREANLRGLLKIPPEIVPFSLVAVGHPAGEQLEVERYNTAWVHAEVW